MYCGEAVYNNYQHEFIENTQKFYNFTFDKENTHCLEEGSHLARKHMLSIIHEHDTKAGRDYLVNYFTNLIQIIDNFEENRNDFEKEYLKNTISGMKRNLDSFKKIFHTVDRLLETSSLLFLNKPKVLFHAYLEIHWLQLIFITKYTLLKESLENDDNVKKSYDTILSEIGSIMFSMISVSYKVFCKNGYNSLFSCDCVLELWKHVRKLVDNLNRKQICPGFWAIFNEIITRNIIPSTNVIENTNFPFSAPYKINSKHPVSFSINIMKHLVQTQNKEIANENYPLLEYVLKNIEDEDLSESNLRLLMSDICYLVNVWKPKAEIIITLWEFFHKKLNAAFTLSNDNNLMQSFEKLSIPEVVKELRGLSGDSYTGESCSYLLFLRMLGLFLKNNYSQMQISQCQRIKGRILPKFTTNKIEALNDVGFRNFCTLFLVMATSTNIEEICPKLSQLLNQLNFSNMENSKQYLMLKVELIMVYLYVEEEKNANSLIEPLVSLLSEYSSLRDHSSNKLMSCVCKGIHDIVDVSSTLNNGEALLIGPWLSKYLVVCPYSDLLSTLSALTFLVTKTRQIFRYHVEGSSFNDSSEKNNQSVELLVSNLFANMLPCLKSLFSNEETALNVADVILEFIKLTIENTFVYENHMKTNDLLKLFIQSEKFHERAAHHFLINLLEQDDIILLLEDSDKISEILLIECWVKCALLHNETCSQLSPSLGNLQHLKHIKQILPYIDITETNQNHLSLFFFGLGSLWKNCQTFQEKCKLRNSVNQYLGPIDKLIATIVKTCSSSKFITEIVMVIGTLFLHCSAIIYFRARPTCLLHSIVSTLLLPPQIFIENKQSSHLTAAVCRSWFIFTCGIFQLDKDNDPYIENTLRDFLVYYLPHFVNISGGEQKYEITHRLLPNEVTASYNQLEVFILQKIATTFISCRGKQTHQHASKALAIIHNLSSSNNQRLEIIIKHTFFAIFEQCMFADSGSLSSKLAYQVLEAVNTHLESCAENSDLKSSIKDITIAVCKKYFSFYSNQFFKLIASFPVSLKIISKEIIPYLETEVAKLERMRGVKEDAGLRAGLKNLANL